MFLFVIMVLFVPSFSLPEKINALQYDIICRRAAITIEADYKIVVRREQ